MKKFSNFNLLMFIFLLLVSLSSCQEEKFKHESSSDIKANNTFFIKNVDGSYHTQLPPQILSSINQKLIAKGRVTDAENLFKTYDATTGTLLSGVNVPNKGGRVAAAYSVYLDGHSRNKGWSYNIPLGGIVGYEGEHLRLEAFRVNLNPYNGSGAQTLEYAAHCAGIGWQPNKNPGELAGTLYQSRAIQAIWFNVNPNFATEVYYRAHVAGIGWMAWVSNGQVAGTVGQNRDLEAFQLSMVVY